MAEGRRGGLGEGKWDEAIVCALDAGRDWTGHLRWASSTRAYAIALSVHSHSTEGLAQSQGWPPGRLFRASGWKVGDRRQSFDREIRW